MTALAGLNDILDRLSGGSSGTPQLYFLHKTSRAAGTATPTVAANTFISYWKLDGNTGVGVTPGAGAIPDRTSNGAIPLTAPGGSRERWLIGASGISSTSGTILIYDRLYHISGLSGSSTSSQTVQGSPASPALTRNTGGEGNIAFAEIYTAIGTTAASLTMTYTNQDGTGSRSASTSIGAANSQYRAFPLNMQAGDTGIQSVQSVQLAATTGAAGDFGITIAKPICIINLTGTSTGEVKDFVTGMPIIPKIENDACLGIMVLGTTAVTNEILVNLSMVEA